LFFYARTHAQASLAAMGIRSSLGQKKRFPAQGITRLRRMIPTPFFKNTSNHATAPPWLFFYARTHAQASLAGCGHKKTLNSR